MNPFPEEHQEGVSVVIVSWNTRALLKGCLASIERPVEGPAVDVIVVDNASGDGSAEMVRRDFPHVRLIENEENDGYAKANNQGIRTGCSEYVLLLNSDAALRPGAIQLLAGFLQTNPKVSAVGPRVTNPDGSLQTSCYPTPTLFREFWRMFHLDALIPLGSYAMSRWEQDRPREVEILLGACILVRRAALEHVGLLNEIYFMYSEDLDLCHRLRKAGGKIFWVPGAEILHHGGRSTRQISREMFLQLYRSKLMFFRIYYGGLSASIYKLILLAASIARLSLRSLAPLLVSRDRSEDAEQAYNYRQLIRTLLS
ncbi:MAG TPA: glycosyltransferase family 2 protein [Anaerolineales bacterium]|nr:glycosyltransferase family 2 protein [Anaerolineales bacterium]